MKIILFLILLISQIHGQTIYTQKDVDICNAKFEFAADNELASLPIAEVMVKIGKTFLGVNYEAFTLEKGEKENVVVNLSGLDCYTFYESTLAMSRCVKSGETSFNSFIKEIENIRYRNGERTDYISRLHYACDWLWDNQKRGIVKDITESIGGIELEKKVDFMSSHPQLYKRLKNDSTAVNKIRCIEKQINKRKYFYIPQNKIKDSEEKIIPGDIIYCTTKMDGLLIGHTGIAVKLNDGRIHFMHAPLVGSKVQISSLPLPDYIKAVKKHTGIMVLRVSEPK